MLTMLNSNILFSKRMFKVSYTRMMSSFRQAYKCKPRKKIEMASLTAVLYSTKSLKILR